MLRKAQIHHVRRHKYMRVVAETGRQYQLPQYGELAKVSNWLASNSLTLNVNKCHYVVFRFRKQQARDNINIEFNNQSLVQQTSRKYLGVILHEHLCFTEHLDNVGNKYLSLFKLFMRLSVT